MREDNQVVEQVSNAEVEFFKPPSMLTAPNEDSETERIAIFEIITASFQDRYGWRLTDGQMTLTAHIEDEEFLARIEAGERFGKGDLMRVRLLERQWRDDKGLHAEYRIVEVLEVKPSAKQMPLV